MRTLRPLVAALLGLSAIAHAAPADLPHFTTEGGRHALIVDGAPFLILGGQCGNSSAWPSELPAVWTAVARIHANTLEAPVYWEQFEPEEGHFDTSSVDLLIQQARQHGVRLVLLWFGTYKNGSAHYEPLWMKAHQELYPRVIGKDGVPVDSPSPLFRATLDKDVRAFRALMRHLRSVDGAHTVILVQVENESGTWGSVRDYSPQAQALFQGPVPATLLSALGLHPAPGADWSAVFGANADEFFHAWSVATFVGTVAAAGKQEYPLPLYTNAALRDPLTPGPASTYESGGPTDDVIAVWKAAAPALDAVAPDIYQGDEAKYRRVLELYARPDNPLLIPETIGFGPIPRMVYAAIGHGAVGWAPFGIDRPGDAAREEEADPVGVNFRILGPVMREVARLSFEGKLQAVSESADVHTASMDFGSWRATVAFGAPRFGFGKPTKGNPEPVGGAVVGELGSDAFFVTGRSCRVDIEPVGAAPNAHREFLRVEEGRFADGVFIPSRIWNGDQTDYGLSFSTAPVALRVRLRTF